MDNFIVIWTGKSGKQYGYGIYPIQTSFRSEPGNFIISRQTSENIWEPCYISYSNNLHKFPSLSFKEKCIMNYGATHIHVHLTLLGDETRKVEADDLIAKWLPPANQDKDIVEQRISEVF